MSGLAPIRLPGQSPTRTPESDADHEGMETVTITVTVAPSRSDESPAVTVTSLNHSLVISLAKLIHGVYPLCCDQCCCARGR